MARLLFLSFLYVLVLPDGYAQAGKPVRYRDFVFSGVIKESDWSYLPPSREGGKRRSGRKGRAHLLDLYVPAGDSMAGDSVDGGMVDGGVAEGGVAERNMVASDMADRGRPLILWMHGGGFKFGSKNAGGIRMWCEGFARRGYVCAAINYRLSRGNSLGSFKALVEGCYDAVEDARAAIAFCKSRARQWGIDTNRIILAGNSAGGMIALQAAYSHPDELLKLAGDTVSRGALWPSGGIAAVINFWGAIFRTDWLADARVPIVSVHGRRDRIVRIDQNGSNLFGSLAIHTKADSLSIPNRIKIYEGYSHELQKHFNPLLTGGATRRRWQEAGQFAADFLYEELFR